LSRQRGRPDGGPEHAFLGEAKRHVAGAFTADDGISPEFRALVEEVARAVGTENGFIGDCRTGDPGAERRCAIMQECKGKYQRGESPLHIAGTEPVKSVITPGNLAER
jgi:hypothetical protein